VHTADSRARLPQDCERQPSRMRERSPAGDGRSTTRHQPSLPPQSNASSQSVKPCLGDERSKFSEGPTAKQGGWSAGRMPSMCTAYMGHGICRCRAQVVVRHYGTDYAGCATRTCEQCIALFVATPNLIQARALRCAAKVGLHAGATQCEVPIGQWKPHTHGRLTVSTDGPS
jgi:hypothetical protein